MDPRRHLLAEDRGFEIAKTNHPFIHSVKFSSLMREKDLVLVTSEFREDSLENFYEKEEESSMF